MKFKELTAITFFGLLVSATSYADNNGGYGEIEENTQNEIQGTGSCSDSHDKIIEEVLNLKKNDWCHANLETKNDPRKNSAWYEDVNVGGCSLGGIDMPGLPTFKGIGDLGFGDFDFGEMACSALQNITKEYVDDINDALDQNINDKLTDINNEAQNLFSIDLNEIVNDTITDNQ